MLLLPFLELAIWEYSKCPCWLLPFLELAIWEYSKCPCCWCNIAWAKMAPDVVVVVSVVVVVGVISLGQKWPRNLMTNCHIDAFRILLRNECCHACRIATQSNTDAINKTGKQNHIHSSSSGLSTNVDAWLEPIGLGWSFASSARESSRSAATILTNRNCWAR